jgi:hypothetical protein
MNVQSQTIYTCCPLKDVEKPFKVKVVHQMGDRISILFLEPTSFCWIGYYKWYFKKEFFSIFKLYEEIN